jgi:hypothetical protein
VDTGTTDLEDLGQQVRASDADGYVRALLARGEDGWELCYCWALVGFEPPGWEEPVREYGQLAFVFGCVPARGLASLRMR